jgi:hypothetical protein
MTRSSLALAVASCLLIAAGSSYAQKSAPSSTDTVVFAVWPAQKGKTPDTPLLDPIVVVNGKQFRKPPEYDDSTDAKKQVSEAEFARFNKEYYSHGQVYPLLIHGNAAGSVTVEKQTSISCIDHMASVRLSLSLQEHHLGLATSSMTGFGVHPDRDREVTEEDRSAFLDVAAAYFRRKGINLPAGNIKIDRLYSVSLSADTPNELIGSVTGRQKSAIHHLFLLALKTDRGYVTDFSSYHVAKDVVDHTDDVSEGFVEHLDLDNDGFDEIITMSHYYESWDYAILRRENGQWKVVYQGGGGGC